MLLKPESCPTLHLIWKVNNITNNPLAQKFYEGATFMSKQIIYHFCGSILFADLLFPILYFNCGKLLRFKFSLAFVRYYRLQYSSYLIALSIGFFDFVPHITVLRN